MKNKILYQLNKKYIFEEMKINNARIKKQANHMENEISIEYKPRG